MQFQNFVVKKTIELNKDKFDSRTPEFEFESKWLTCKDQFKDSEYTDKQ